MKKMFILMLIATILPSTAFAYRINTQDTSAYSFRDGKSIGKEGLVRGVFEVDEEKGIITEVSTKVDMDGQQMDLAKYNPTFWNIVKNDNGNIVSMRTIVTPTRGEDIFVLRNDGTYYLFQSFYDINIPNGQTMHDWSSLFFGKYTKVD